jgi:S1-C subfamily serine protease
MGVGYTVGTEVALVTEPLDASDQVSCLEHGVPAVQLFTGPTADYHRPSDTADTVDAEGMAAVAEVAHEVITYLAQRTEPLTVTIAERPSAKREPASADAQERRASLGTMPDFAFAGPGVKVAAITPGSAAAAAGIEAGDVLRALNGEPIADLRGLAGLLRQHAPGDEVAVTLNRNDTKLSIQVTLGER